MRRHENVLEMSLILVAEVQATLNNNVKKKPIPCRTQVCSIGVEICQSEGCDFDSKVLL